jgi:tetratricopeptide (TPR) repeat protein
MSLQRLFKTFRSSLVGDHDDSFTLEEEVSLYRTRAELAMREERYTDALAFLAKVLRLNPYDLEARLSVAETYHRHLGEATKALLTYEKVIAAANYDDSNPCCMRARQGIRELTSVFESAALPLHDLLEEEIPQEESGGRPQSAAV